LDQSDTPWKAKIFAFTKMEMCLLIQNNEYYFHSLLGLVLALAGNDTTSPVYTVLTLEKWKKCSVFLCVIPDTASCRLSSV